MKKYKIVVLSDLNNSTNTILKSTVGLAKMVNGEIEVFNVKKPTDIVGNTNQLSAIRSINNEHTATDMKLRNLITPLFKDYGVKIGYSFVIGNVKNEISNYLKEQKPDIVVLGKRKLKPFKIIGDSITGLVLNSFNGVVLIADDKNTLEPNKEIKLGVLNNSSTSMQLEFKESLMANVQKPLKSFKIVKNSDTMSEEPTSTEIVANKKTIEYVFEHNDNTIKNLSKYLSKNDVNLLYMDRGSKKSGDSVNIVASNINEVIGNLNVSLLINCPKKN